MQPPAPWFPSPMKLVEVLTMTKLELFLSFLPSALTLSLVFAAGEEQKRTTLPPALNVSMGLSLVIIEQQDDLAPFVVKPLSEVMIAPLAPNPRKSAQLLQTCLFLGHNLTC